MDLIDALRAAACGVVVVGLVTVGAGAAEAAPDPTGRAATFQGRTVDLTQGWGEAKTCIIFGLTDTRCYAAHDEADRVVGYSRADDPLVASAAHSGVLEVAPSCADGWFCLYENKNGGGRRLIFNEEIRHPLAEWGFSEKTSSWRNNQASNDWGGLFPLGGAPELRCAPVTYVADMGVYDDWAVAVSG